MKLTPVYYYCYKETQTPVHVTRLVSNLLDDRLKAEQEIDRRRGVRDGAARFAEERDLDEDDDERKAYSHLLFSIDIFPILFPFQARRRDYADEGEFKEQVDVSSGQTLY